MYQFIKYYNAKEEEWDHFISEKSVNGTFLQSRNFLNYHLPERFLDASLLIYDQKENLVGICPACEDRQKGRKIFFSHMGSTFGGIIIEQKNYKAEFIINLLNEFKNYLKKEGYQEIYLKQTSDIFSGVRNDLFQFCFQYNGFDEQKELSLYIDFSQYKEEIISNFSHGKRECVRKGVKAGFIMKEICEDLEIKEFYTILCENLHKYSVSPVHRVEELLEFKNHRLLEECAFFGVYQGSEMVAGSMMFFFNKRRVAHAQYLAAKQKYNKLSPMTFLYYSIIKEMRNRGYQKISWGIVTENRGKVINTGLVNSKENFGGMYCNNLTYHINL